MAVGPRHLKPPLNRLEFDPAVMKALPFEKIILCDVAKGDAIVFYDRWGGLGKAAVAAASKDFAFLEDFNFNLNRHEGALSTDKQGNQRMIMLGLRRQGYNTHKRPDLRRRGLKVANPRGDLDTYVLQLDEREGHLQPERMSATWNAISACMGSMLPAACKCAARELRKARLRKRIYSEHALTGSCSQDLLVNNIGVSAAYQSPSHRDRNDVGWTFALAVKCA